MCKDAVYLKTQRRPAQLKYRRWREPAMHGAWRGCQSGRLAFVPRAVGTRDSNMTRFMSRKDLWDGSVENEIILSEM